MTELSRRAPLRHGAAWAALGVAAPAVRADGLVVGQAAPVAVLHSLDGRTLSTATLRGKVVILTFWATWCDPRREELPLLSRYAAARGGAAARASVSLSA